MVSARHQSLLHFVGRSSWDDGALLRAVADWVLPAIGGQGPIRAWIVDDTGFPKKGRHSVGVARQYCGQLGKQDNCQVAVTLSVASDPARRSKAGVPDNIVFRSKPVIALEQIGAALAAGVTPGVVVADAGYGIDTGFRSGVSALGLRYVVGIQSSTSLWPPGTGPLPPRVWGGRGRPVVGPPQSRPQPVSAKDLAQTLADDAWRVVTWREGTNAPLTSRFAAVRLRPAHRDYSRPTPRPEEGHRPA